MGTVAHSRAEARLQAAEGQPSTEVCEEIVRAFHDVTRFSWCAVMTTDPET